MYCKVKVLYMNIELPWITFLVLQKYDEKCLRLLIADLGVNLVQILAQFETLSVEYFSLVVLF